MRWYKGHNHRHSKHHRPEPHRVEVAHLQSEGSGRAGLSQKLRTEDWTSTKVMLLKQSCTGLGLLSSMSSVCYFYFQGLMPVFRHLLIKEP